MFTIAIKQNQYITYILEDEKALSRLEVVPERGGIITRWKVQGQNILYLDEERFKDSKLSVRGGIPILFPICGNLPDDSYVYQNKIYKLKQHGFGRDLPWKVITQETDNCASITLMLKSNEQTRSVYPFDFEVKFNYKIEGNFLKIRQFFTNKSTEKMPFSVGLHPYFWTKDKSQLEIDIPSHEYQNQQTKEIHPFTGSFDFSQDEIDVGFGSLTRQTTSLTDKQRRLQVKLNYSDIYSTIVFWTVKGKDYVCLEPWSAPRNALNTGEKLTYIEPGNTIEAFVEMIYGTTQISV